MDLTSMEKLALKGLMARDQAIQQEIARNPVVLAVQEDFAAWRAEIEKRLGLPEGAIGMTHQVDGETGTIILPAQSEDAPIAPPNRAERRASRKQRTPPNGIAEAVPADVLS